MSEALLPCPFCGGDNIQRADNAYGAFWTICDECGACTGEAGIHSQAEADERWNRRPSQSEQSAAPVPAEWQLVPKQPTEAMIDAVDKREDNLWSTWSIWQVMLAAAPVATAMKEATP